MTNAKQRHANKLSRATNNFNDERDKVGLLVAKMMEDVDRLLSWLLAVVERVLIAITRVVDVWYSMWIPEYLDLVSFYCMVWKHCGLFTLCLRLSWLWGKISGTAAMDKNMLTQIRQLQPMAQSPQQWLQDNTTASGADENYRKGLRGCGHLATGLAGRSVTGRLVTFETVAFRTGLMELPGFLTEKECDILLEEMNMERANLKTMKRSEDVYSNGSRRPNRQAVSSYSSRLPCTGRHDCDEKLSRPFARLMKMVEPFVSTVSERRGYQYGVIKQYDADRSSQVGITLHSDSTAYTLIVYLDTVSEPKKSIYSSFTGAFAGGNDSYNNGCTTFPHLGLSFRPVKGNAIWFRNYLPDDYVRYGLQREHRTLDFWLQHIGEPVTNGKKTIIQFVSC